jgi:hypothetical protein
MVVLYRSDFKVMSDGHSLFDALVADLGFKDDEEVVQTITLYNLDQCGFSLEDKEGKVISHSPTEVDNG